jgi:NADPH:quinone reductase-like Zn-dependent oxidoreductase
VAVGDEVIGTADGSFAELAVVPQGRVARKPTTLSFEEAATLPVSGLTAIQAVRDGGRIQPGDRVLVIGASGGVGSYAVQIAAAYGAEVTGVASGGKADLVRSLGATRVIDYTREDLDDGTRYDVVLDIAGRRPIRHLRRLLADTGTLVIIGGEGGDRWLGGTHRQIAALALSPFVSQRLTALLSKENADDLDTLAQLVDQGRVRPALERTYALHDAAKAIDHVGAGHARGKVAVIP